MSNKLTRRSFLGAGGALLAGAPWPRAAQARRPNILFVIADDWGYRHAGVYGCKWVNTPNFDRVAREGVVFTNCFTSNPKCSPSRASLLTGRNSWQTKQAVSHYSTFPKEFPVYPDLLEEAGYFVGFTGKGWGPGDFQTTGWKRNPAGTAFQKRTLDPPQRGIAPRDYAANFADFLEQRPSGAPFCFWMGTHEPHRVYEPGAGIRAGKNPADVELPPYYPDNATIRGDLLDYATEVEWFDRHLGLALRKLQEAGELDNTFVLVTSDNGMPFPRVKGQIYDEAFHLPMAVRWGRNIGGGRTIEDTINFRDFAPTFMELAGLKPVPSMTGRSFLDALKSGKSGVVDPSRSVMLAGKERHDLGRPNDAAYPIRAIRTPEYLYLRNYEPDRWPVGNPETGYRNCDDGPTKEFILARFDEYYRMSFGKRPPEELYLVRSDPHCVKNVAADPRYAQVKNELRRKMEEMLKEEGDPRMLGKADFFDTIEYTGPRNHSYDNWLKFSKP